MGLTGVEPSPTSLTDDEHRGDRVDPQLVEQTGLSLPCHLLVSPLPESGVELAAG